jgi:YHS domain-containing protein
MKKVVLILALGFLFLKVFSAKYETELQQQQTITDSLKKDGLDPVCKMKVKTGNTKTVVFNKVTYGFCSESCKKTFAADPKKYLKK